MWLFSSMCQLVDCKIIATPETLPTCSTMIWLFSCVDHLVCLEMTLSRKSLSTLRTLMWQVSSPSLTPAILRFCRLDRQEGPAEDVLPSAAEEIQHAAESDGQVLHRHTQTAADHSVSREGYRLWPAVSPRPVSLQDQQESRQDHRWSFPSRSAPISETPIR